MQEMKKFSLFSNYHILFERLEYVKMQCNDMIHINSPVLFGVFGVSRREIYNNHRERRKKPSENSVKGKICKGGYFQ